VEAFFEVSDVDVDDIAVFEALGSGDAVANDLVDRRADAFRKAVIVERRRARPAAQRVLVDEAIDIVGRHARAQDVPHFEQRFGRELAGAPQRGDFFG